MLTTSFWVQQAPVMTSGFSVYRRPVSWRWLGFLTLLPTGGHRFSGNLAPSLRRKRVLPGIATCKTTFSPHPTFLIVGHGIHACFAALGGDRSQMFSDRHLLSRLFPLPTHLWQINTPECNPPQYHYILDKPWQIIRDLPWVLKYNDFKGEALWHKEVTRRVAVRRITIATTATNSSLLTKTRTMRSTGIRRSFTEDREDVEAVEVEPRGDGDEDDWRDAA